MNEIPFVINFIIVIFKIVKAIVYLIASFASVLQIPIVGEAFRLPLYRPNGMFTGGETPPLLPSEKSRNAVLPIYSSIASSTACAICFSSSFADWGLIIFILPLKPITHA